MNAWYTAAGADKLGLVNSTVPEPETASKLQLWYDDKLADSRGVFDIKPLVKRAAAAGGPGSPLTLQWDFVNASPGATITYDIQTSPNGYIWSTYMVGLKDDHLALTPNLAKIQWWRVIANDGVHNSDPITVKRPINAGGALP